MASPFMPATWSACSRAIDSMKSRALASRTMCSYLANSPRPTSSPAVFAGDEIIEVTTSDESSSATLSFANGGMILENSQVAVATLNPAKVFGGAAFGPLQFRINYKGVVGDWQPLANLVRLPMLKELKCPATPELACKLSGSNLFLIDSVSSDAEFTRPVKVPDG